MIITCFLDAIWDPNGTQMGTFWWPWADVWRPLRVFWVPPGSPGPNAIDELSTNACLASCLALQLLHDGTTAVIGDSCTAIGSGAILTDARVINVKETATGDGASALVGTVTAGGLSGIDKHSS